MKSIILLSSLLLSLLTLQAQGSKSCSKPKVVDIDINSITKCSLGDEKKKTSHYRKKKSRGKKNKLKAKKILFSVVDKVPLFPKCKSSKIKNKKSCFTKEFRKHIKKHFYAEQASDNGIKGRFFVRFTVGISGKIKHLSIKVPKKAKRLKKEIKRIISKLPHLVPGKHLKVPVDVEYSLNFSLTN